MSRAAPSTAAQTGLTLALLADTHERHREIEVPDGDVLIHAGDFTLFSSSATAICDFNSWLGELPHRHKIICPGNHELFLEQDPRRRSLLSHATVLIDEGIGIDGLRLWASPVTPGFGAAFSMSSADRLRRHWATMPEVDVLVTHGPPYGILDRSPQGEHIGDPELLAAVQQRNPLLHVFGHVHGAYGQVEVGATRYVNCASPDEDGEMVNGPIVLWLPRQK